MSTIELDLGVVGPHSYGEKFQKEFHKLVDDPCPRGWDNQLKDELVLGINYDYKWKLIRSGIEHDFSYDLITQIGGALGNAYTGATTGMGIWLWARITLAMNLINLPLK